jgi:hypothetical protein
MAQAWLGTAFVRCSYDGSPGITAYLDQESKFIVDMNVVFEIKVRSSKT